MDRVEFCLQKIEEIKKEVMGLDLESEVAPVLELQNGVISHLSASAKMIKALRDMQAFSAIGDES